MSPAQLFALSALFACACAETYYKDDAEISAIRGRSSRAVGNVELPQGCMYEGRWFADGATVRTREACLLCICSHGALSCRRRACAPLPEPPPRCHVLHRRGECCPELHCPDRIMLLEHGASARFEDNDYSMIATPASIRHAFPACVEGGTVYAAGSAMGAGAACEQCFCLGGARRCVRPRCLPPPPGCTARPAPGVCCPQRYYCEHATSPTTRPPDQKHPHDCEGPDGRRVLEGNRVPSDTDSKCTQCFCLRGSVRCQHLSCAPPLLGCTPLVLPDQCCPHQYQCDHARNGSVETEFQSLWHNSLLSIKDEDRSFHASKSTKRETTVKVSSTVIDKTTQTVPTKISSDVTTKVKRKTDDLPPVSTTSKVAKEENATTTQSTIKIVESTTKLSSTSIESTTSADIQEKNTTELPEATVKIMINGTINCTTELTSTSLSLNVSHTNDTEKIEKENTPGVPLIDTTNIEAHTFSPMDIITNRYGGFDENETFIINVTSSLTANSTKSTTTSTTTTTTAVPMKAVPTALLEKFNISKKTKEDYDYDYTEPTLPPSLPNLKIIPFVAADAVVEDEISSKESLTYPLLEREDKFPVYYPSVESKESSFPSRREDIYHPTQYPVFISKKMESPQYPITQEADLSNIGYPGVTNDLSTSVHEYTVTASLGSAHSEINKSETKMPSTSAHFEIETPAVNLFSPPVETEGGFIPKGPGIIDEYYAVYPSTPSGPVVPHLTTSMQLDTDKGECISSDGRVISSGESINLACSTCACAWGELHCSPRPCHTPAGCTRRPATDNSVELCCGELLCDHGSKTTPSPIVTTRRFEIPLNDTIVPHKNQTQIQNQDHEIVSTAFNHTMSTTPMDTLDINESKINSNKSEIPLTTTASIPIKTETVTIKTTTTVAVTDKETQNYNHSLEYEDDDDDEGFSFGSVLKLLLSDNYDATTLSPNKKKTSPQVTTTYMPTTTSKPIIPSRSPPNVIMNSFVPVTHHYSYIPPKKVLPQNTIDRIDHLVLGEAMAIRTTSRPVTTTTSTTTIKPSTTTTKKSTAASKTTPHFTPSKPLEIKEKVDQLVINDVPRPAPNSLGPGLLKLAGCNIYGRMYRVGRIIAELSTPCQECRCTEIGVQCRPLNC